MKNCDRIKKIMDAIVKRSKKNKNEIKHCV